eukprot:116859_1
MGCDASIDHHRITCPGSSTHYTYLEDTVPKDHVRQPVPLTTLQRTSSHHAHTLHTIHQRERMDTGYTTISLFAMYLESNNEDYTSANDIFDLYDCLSHTGH